jgi:predicted amidohydrolase
LKVAAYQAPVLESGSMDALGLIRARVDWCESAGVSILCCPEAILGGLADDADDPLRFAIPAGHGQLDAALSPLASDRVTSIVGFTEIADDGALYNGAAVLHRGSVAGVYRKLHPAINRSVYRPGRELPVFRVDGLTFGIVICNDSNLAGPARSLADLGATVLFVPTNNGLPPGRAHADVVEDARRADIARAVENQVWIVRADVAGRTARLVSMGSTAIVNPSGSVVQSARRLGEDLIVAEIGDAGLAGIQC